MKDELRSKQNNAGSVSCRKFTTCLKPGKIIILDNASAHKSEEIIDLAREAGCKVIFLPPYSPDLNPIEKFWANLKRAIKSVMLNSGSLEAAITNAFCKLYRSSYRGRASLDYKAPNDLFLEKLRAA